MDKKHIKGDWYSEFSQLSSISPNGQITIKAGEAGTPIAILPMPIGATVDRQTERAKLIIDAGTTANKCGLLPSELLAQRDELLEACKDSFRILTLSPTNDNLYQRNKLFTLINKIQGEQP